MCTATRSDFNMHSSGMRRHLKTLAMIQQKRSVLLTSKFLSLYEKCWLLGRILCWNVSCTEVADDKECYSILLWRCWLTFRFRKSTELPNHLYCLWRTLRQGLYWGHRNKSYGSTPSTSYPAFTLPSPSYYPCILQSSSRFVHTIVGNGNHVIIFVSVKRFGQVDIGHRELEENAAVGRKGKTPAPSSQTSVGLLSVTSVYSVTDMPIARQRLYKHIPENTLPTIGHLLIGNGPINTHSWQQKTVFSVGSVPMNCKRAQS
jgi:hypothetical protein